MEGKGDEEEIAVDLSDTISAKLMKIKAGTYLG